jgi:hypothetical protein
VVGSAIAASNDGYYYGGYRRCAWVRQFDAYGNYMGRPHLQLLRHDRPSFRLNTSWIQRPAWSLIHPVPHPTRPVVPPGGSSFLDRVFCFDAFSTTDKSTQSAQIAMRTGAHFA